MQSLINNKQKQVIHAAARKCGLIDKYGCKEQYKMVLINVTGKNSSTRLTQGDYDKLVIWFRDTYQINIGSAPSTQHSAQSTSDSISSRQRYRINEMMSQISGISLAGVIKQIFRVDIPLADLKKDEASRVISALQDIRKRDAVRSPQPVAQSRNMEANQ